jgi:hypothetical protein
MRDEFHLSHSRNHGSNSRETVLAAGGHVFLSRGVMGEGDRESPISGTSAPTLLSWRVHRRKYSPHVS